MIKAIIFDMDGTVLNTIDDIHRAVNHALEMKNCPTKTLDEVKRAVGNGARKLIERVCPSSFGADELDEVFHLYQNYYDAHNNDFTGPYEGILTLLETLKKRGYLLAVVSNKFEHLVQGLNNDVFKHLFDVAIGEVKGIPIKPAPDMVYKALDVLGVQHHETLFVGDSEVDMDTATNAKLTSVGVTWGFRSEELLRKHQANYIIHQPLELLEIMDEVNLK
jgi:phosphoglycolate phosphatase